MQESTRRTADKWRTEPETRALRGLQTAMADAENAMSRRMRLGHTDMAAMTHLATAREAVGPTWLSGRLGLTPAATTELVDRLERVGHLSRERDGADRRRVKLIPTEGSLDQVNDHLRPLLDSLDNLAASFTNDERAAICQFLAAVTAVYGEFADDGERR